MSESREYFTKCAENGTINISSEVVLAIAAAAAAEVDGVASMNTNFGAELPDRIMKKAVGKGVRLDMWITVLPFRQLLQAFRIMFAVQWNP